MGLDEWGDMLPHTVTIEPFTGLDQRGEYSYGAGVSYRGRVQGKATLVTNTQGEEMVSHVTIYIPYASVTAQDRVTLPSPFSPTQPSIMTVQQVSDGTGQHHTVIYA
jgi:hypothetical protein